MGLIRALTVTAAAGYCAAFAVMPLLAQGASGAQAKPAEPPARFGIGRAATPAEIAAWDIDIGPDGTGLPPGRGSAADGAKLYGERCASCHGATGREGPNDVLVAPAGATGFSFSRDPKLPRTVGNYWPYATTLFDYIRRAMPPSAPGSLRDDEVYALVAQLLVWNGLAPEGAVMDAATLAKIRMPARDRFVPDPRSKIPPPRR